MNPATPPLMVTAATLAAALGERRQAVVWQLKGVAPAGHIIVKGELRPRYTFASLPGELRHTLTMQARRHGFADPEPWLAELSRPWLPPVPLSEVAPEYLERAIRLQKAMLPFLERYAARERIGGEIEDAGLNQFKQVFGYEISARYWRELFQRTIARDAGADNWARLELFLDQRPARRPDAPAAPDPAAAREFEELLQAIAQSRNPAQPSAQEKANLWTLAVENYNAKIETGQKPPRVKRALLDFLWQHAPWLASSPNALRVNFERKLQRWIGGEMPAALVDDRETRRGEPVAAPYDEDSIDAIVWHAATNCGGRISQAVRELAEAERLEPQVVRSLLRSQSKSYIPARLRQAVTPNTRLMEIAHQGPHAIDCATPSLSLHYRGIYSMTCLMADDFTFPVYFYVPDGNGWFRLTRGQCLLVIDFRTLMVLGYALLPEKQYHATAIRTVFTRVFAERGLPKVLYLERGIWMKSKLVTGGPKARRILQEDEMPYSWPECEMGLRQFGIQFIHAKRARSKPVERVGGMLQDLMEREKGYCGRDERKDCPEKTKRAKADVEFRREHPSKFFSTFEQWDERLEQICQLYNASRQQGKRLPDLTPEQAFKEFQNPADPPSCFDASCRYRLAHHKIPVEVKDNGISFRIGKEQYRYFDQEEISRWRYHKLIAWFNPEDPEILTLTDQNERNAFTVGRRHEVSALAQLTGEQEGYQEEVKAAAGFNSYLTTRYRVLKLKFQQTFRQNLVSPRTVELGKEMERQQSALRAGQEQEDTRRERIQKMARQLSIPIGILRDYSEDTENRLARQLARRRHSQPDPQLEKGDSL